MSEEARNIPIEDPAEEAAKEERTAPVEGESADESAASPERGDDAAGEEPADDPEDGSDARKETEPADEPEKAEGDDARYLRLLAEFQNYKKRTEKEKSDLYSYANEKIMTELLEVMDNFERALEQPAGDRFKEGMELIFNQLGSVLNRAGLAEISALGEEFDPNVHNAVMTEETEEYESGKVSGVMQKGYTLNGKVIRPSMVRVVN